MLNNCMYIYSELRIVYTHGDTIFTSEYSLVNIVWDTASTGSFGGTVYSLGGYVIR